MWVQVFMRLPTCTLNINCRTRVAQNKICTTLIFYSKFSVGWKLMLPTVKLIMKISLGCRKQLWPSVIGLCIVLMNVCIGLIVKKLLMCINKIGMTYLDTYSHSGHGALNIRCPFGFM